MSKVLVIGATGTIGKGIVEQLSPEYEVIQVGYQDGDFQVDLGDKDSIKALFQKAGSFDALVSAAGLSKFGAFDALTDEDYYLGIHNKMMGQINLVREGLAYITDGGSFTLTSGMLSHSPTPMSVTISMVNSGLEGFTRAAALAMPRGIRINVVSPVFIKETMEAMGMDGKYGMPASQAGIAYKESVESHRNGEVMDVRDFV